MVMVIAPDMVPPEKYGKYNGIVSTVFIVASVLSHVLSGIINTHSKPTAEIRQYEANLVFRGGLVTPNSLEKLTYHIAV
ncbi:hypothetical protein IFM46972_08470 [Aspergillus udagawae]|uniref:Uncharacterized protein n=1 Tax=Aspergillus udagawae TaxID=91492 RepID=A0A8H3PC65_9EURO|nr:hypothetical protein IFM46972_08470 [Aspergillus udagawae]